MNDQLTPADVPESLAHSVDAVLVHRQFHGGIHTPSWCCQCHPESCPHVD